MSLKIYIAGPDVFCENAIEIGKKHKEKCEEFGFEGLYPLDNICSTSKEIADGNFGLIDKCDVVVANMNPFRGKEPDSGTCCEIGYAIAKGKRVICYMADTRSMVDKYGTVDENGMAIEDFGHPLNLMIAEKADIVEGDFETAIKHLCECTVEV